MRARWRVVVAMVVFAVLGYVSVRWATVTVGNMSLWSRDGFVDCDSSVFSRTNGCTTFRPSLAWAELAVVAATVPLVAWLLTRWTLRPVADMAAAVQRFGPNSLALRLDAGPGRDETVRLAGAVDAMLARLAEGYEAQRRFAANASHELRTPLATQRALVEVSMADPLTPDQQDLLSRQLLATNERNERLIDALLTLAEAEQGLRTQEDLRLDEVVTDVVRVQRRRALEHGVEITVTAPPLVVRGERALLERLLSNLVGNAVKYNDAQGSVHVGVDAGRSTVSVSNTGPLVPPEAVTALFEPFRRLAGDRLAHGDGVGLGLTIVRSIAAAHGGEVAAFANPTGGLTVVTRFPVPAAG